MRKEEQLVQAAKAKSAAVSTWADFSNFLFNPEDGLLITAYPTRTERAAFVKTPEYHSICKLLLEVQRRTGLVEGATPKENSGRFVVRLPLPLQAALEAEAQREGVSLNELVVAKLACQFGTMLQRS